MSMAMKLRATPMTWHLPLSSHDVTHYRVVEDAKYHQAYSDNDIDADQAPGKVLSLTAWFQLPSGVPKFTPPAPMKPNFSFFSPVSADELELRL